jgi:guanine deaminase
MDEKESKRLMRLAIDRARETMNQQIGGPFGALIIDQNHRVVAISSNSVLRDHDATAHAEMNAIREASKALNTHDLSGCVLYTTAFPCPMCLGAIIWSNIKTVYYGCQPIDADHIGFRDDFIYQFMNSHCQDPSVLHLEEFDRDSCLHLFEEYQKKNFNIY